MEQITTWRRFEIIDKSRENALLDLLNEKGITRADLILILRTIKFNPNFDLEAEDCKDHYVWRASDQAKNI